MRGVADDGYGGYVWARKKDSQEASANSLDLGISMDFVVAPGRLGAGSPLLAPVINTMVFLVMVPFLQGMKLLY